MKRNSTSGFTLIETVISLTLLSFITIIGYQGLIFGMNQWRSGHDRMQDQYDYHQAIAWMRDKLGSAEKVRRIGGDDQAYLFDGTPRSVEFVARYDRTRRGGLYVSKIYLDQRDHDLYVSYYLHHPDVARNLENLVPERVVLLADIASIRFSYYGRQLGLKKKAWHDSWPDQNSLPQLLKLDIETVDGVNYETLLSVLTSNNV